MATAQTQFENFHSKILMGYDDNEPLRDRRDTLIQELKDKLSSDVPNMKFFHQGSYALHTGINPLMVIQILILVLFLNAILMMKIIKIH